MEFIWLGDKSNVDLGFQVRRTSKRPGLPLTIDRTLAIAGRHGLYDFGADLGARQFIIDCTFITRNAIELESRVEELARHLLDSRGRPREMQIRFRERPDQHFNARFAGAFDINRIIGTGVFSLPLVAYDPFAYGPERVFETMITESPIEFEIEAQGTVRSNPVIVLTNQGSTTITKFSIVNEYQLE